MLVLTLLTITLGISQPLIIEVGHTVEEYLSLLNLTLPEYAIVVSDQVPQGAAVLHWVEAGQETAIFFFNRDLLLQLSRRERRVLIAHEVSHLIPECQLLGKGISREICADAISLQLVPMDDVAAMLVKSVLLFPYYPAQKELINRLAVIQENRLENGELELKTLDQQGLPRAR